MRFNNEKLETIKSAKPGIALIHLTKDERDLFRQRSASTHSAYTEIAGDRGKVLLSGLMNDLKAN